MACQTICLTLALNVSRSNPSEIAVVLAELLWVTEAELQIENFSVSPLISKVMPPPSRKYTIHQRQPGALSLLCDSLCQTGQHVGG